MALTGVHIACLTVNIVNGASLSGSILWGQTMANAGTTTQAAPSDQSAMSFEISPAADVFVAMGQSPDASSVTGQRILVRGGETRNILAFPGSKVAWVLA